MSKFIDRLDQLSWAAAQPMGFGTKQPASAGPRLQLVAGVAQGDAADISGCLAGADAVLLRISKLSSGARALQGLSRAVPDIICGGWLAGGSPADVAQVIKLGGDFLVFPAGNTPLAINQGDEVGQILEVEASLNEGLLRAANELPLDAVLVAGSDSEDSFLSWQNLLLFRRFTELLTKPLLVVVPSNVTGSELQALWTAGVSGVVVKIVVGQPPGRIGELRQVIDEMVSPSPRRRRKAEPLLPPGGAETGKAVVEEEEDGD